MGTDRVAIAAPRDDVCTPRSRISSSARTPRGSRSPTADGCVRRWSWAPTAASRRHASSPASSATAGAYDQAAVVAHLRPTAPHAADGVAAVPAAAVRSRFCRLRDGRVSIVWTTTPAEAECAVGHARGGVFGARHRRQRSRARRARRSRASAPGSRSRSGTPRAYCRPRLALVGDAAHTIHPLAGQGANLGLLDCACLVEVLSATRSARDEDWTGLRVLRRYERWRRSENALVMGARRRAQPAVRRTQNPAIASLRRFGMSVRRAAALAASRADRARARRARRRAAHRRLRGVGMNVPTRRSRRRRRGSATSIATIRCSASWLRRTLPRRRRCASSSPSSRSSAQLAGGELYRLQLADRLQRAACSRSGTPGATASTTSSVSPLWREAERLTRAARPRRDRLRARATAAMSRIHQFALVYLFHPSPDVYTCPLAMTDGAARTLLAAATRALIDRAVPRLTSRDPAQFWTSGQWMTETHRRLRRRRSRDARGAGRRRLAALRPQVVHLRHHLADGADARAPRGQSRRAARASRCSTSSCATQTAA